MGYNGLMMIYLGFNEFHVAKPIKHDWFYLIGSIFEWIQYWIKTMGVLYRIFSVSMGTQSHEWVAG